MISEEKIYISCFRRLVHVEKEGDACQEGEFAETLG